MRACAPFFPISDSFERERTLARAFPPSCPNACAAGFFLVIAVILHSARLDIKRFRRGSLNLMPGDPCVQVAAAKPNPRPGAVANENRLEAAIVPVDPLCRHSEVDSGLFDGEERMGTRKSSLGTR